MAGETKCCGTCCWYEDFCGVYCNGDSKFVAEFMNAEDDCIHWEEKENE